MASVGLRLGPQLGALLSPFFGWEGSPTKINYRKKGTLIVLTSLLENLEFAQYVFVFFPVGFNGIYPSICPLPCFLVVFSLLVLKGVYHYGKFVLFFPRGEKANGSLGSSFLASPPK